MARSEHLVAAQVPGTLAQLLDTRPTVSRERSDVDLIVHAAGRTFIVECKTSSTAGTVAGAVTQVQQHAKRLRRRAVPMVAVPFMGEVGRRLCEAAEVSWIDLSGNAHIIAPG